MSDLLDGEGLDGDDEIFWCMMCTRPTKRSFRTSFMCCEKCSEKWHDFVCNSFIKVVTDGRDDRYR